MFLRRLFIWLLLLPLIFGPFFLHAIPIVALLLLVISLFGMPHLAISSFAISLPSGRIMPSIWTISSLLTIAAAIIPGIGGRHSMELHPVMEKEGVYSQ
jgi:hypothetical protein